MSSFISLQSYCVSGFTRFAILLRKRFHQFTVQLRERFNQFAVLLRERFTQFTFLLHKRLNSVYGQGCGKAAAAAMLLFAAWAVSLLTKAKDANSSMSPSGLPAHLGFISVYIQAQSNVPVAPNSGRVIFKTTNTTFTTSNNFCTNGR